MGNTIPLPVLNIGGDVFDNTALNMLLPMHVQLDKAGQVVHMGPTFAKLLGNGRSIEGKALIEYVQFSYPKSIAKDHDFTRHYGEALIAQIKSHIGFNLKAIAVPMPGSTGVLINFAFGTSLQQAVIHWQLNSRDFSAADPTVEMLYVIEVQSTLLRESQSLNDRLNGQKQEAEEKAYTDPLTGLPNRRALDRYIKRLCRRRDPCGFAVFLIDLDHFKSVNDTLGHAAGDRVLREVAEILLHQTRPGDIVTRTGGDEFVLVIEGGQDIAKLEAIAGRIIRKIERPICWENQSCHIGASIGIVMGHTKNSHSVELYLQAADEALYTSKKNGRGQYNFSKITT